MNNEMFHPIFIFNCFLLDRRCTTPLPSSISWWPFCITLFGTVFPSHYLFDVLHLHWTVWHVHTTTIQCSFRSCHVPLWKYSYCCEKCLFVQNFISFIRSDELPISTPFHVRENNMSCTCKIAQYSSLFMENNQFRWWERRMRLADMWNGQQTDRIPHKIHDNSGGNTLQPFSCLHRHIHARRNTLTVTIEWNGRDINV